MPAPQNILITGKSQENITNLGSLIHRHYPEAIENSFNSLDWIHLGNDNIGTQALGTHSATLATPAIASNNYGLACNYQISGPHNAFPGGLACAITIVKEILAISIVSSHHREFQLASCLQCSIANNASSSFLRTTNNLWQQLTALIVETINQITAIIHNNIRLTIQCHINISIVFVHITAMMSKNSYPILYQSCTNIILSGQRIGSCSNNLRTCSLQYQSQISGLCLQMHGHNHANTSKRLGYGILLFNSIHYWHKILYPVYLIMTRWCQINIFDFGFLYRIHCLHSSYVSLVLFMFVL